MKLHLEIGGYAFYKNAHAFMVSSMLIVEGLLVARLIDA